MKLIQILPFYLQYPMGSLNNNQQKQIYLHDILNENKLLSLFLEPNVEQTSKRKFLKELRTLNAKLLKLRKSADYTVKHKYYIKMLQNLISQIIRYLNHKTKTENFTLILKDLTVENFLQGLNTLSIELGSYTQITRLPDIKDKTKIHEQKMTKLKLNPAVPLLESINRFDYTKIINTRK